MCLWLMELVLAMNDFSYRFKISLYVFGVVHLLRKTEGEGGEGRRFVTLHITFFFIFKTNLLRMRGSVKNGHLSRYVISERTLCFFLIQFFSTHFQI